MSQEAKQQYLAERYGDAGSSSDVRRKKAKKKHDDLMIRDEEHVWFEHAADEAPPAVQETAPRASTSTGWHAIGLSTSEKQNHVPMAPASRPQAGLLSREQLRAQREARKAAEEAASREAPVAEPAVPQETVYRDAQGRRIDLQEEELRMREEEELRARKEAEKKEWNRGLVQRREEAQRLAMLQQASTDSVSRYEDDARWNDARREQMHWDDPAQAFLSRHSRGRRIVRPVYEGPAPPPNRFGIKPGYRWDGVDRSNGFERKYLVSLNNAQRTKAEFHAWSAEDM